MNWGWCRPKAKGSLAIVCIGLVSCVGVYNGGEEICGPPHGTKERGMSTRAPTRFNLVVQKTAR